MTPLEYIHLVQRRRMLQLASAGELDALREALQDLPIDAADEHGRTALHCAAGAGQEAVVLALLDRDAPIEAATALGLTPLLEACVQAEPDAVAPVAFPEAAIVAVGEQRVRITLPPRSLVVLELRPTKLA